MKTKRILKIYSWIIIAIAAQCAVLLFVDAVYLPHRGVQTTELKEYDSVLANKEVISLKIPDEQITDIQVSCDGEFVSYIVGKEIHVFSTSEKKVVKNLTDDGNTPVITAWLQDRNILMYSFRTQDHKPGEVRLWTYNADLDYIRMYEDAIVGIPSGSHMVSLCFSPKTNVVYANVKVGENLGYLYRYNVMDYIDWVMNTTPDMVFKKTFQSDFFLYSPSPGQLIARNGASGYAYYFYLDGDILLLGSDFQDRVYFGLMDNNGLVREIRHGEIEKAQSEGWGVITPDVPVQPDDLVLSMDGQPYFLDRQRQMAVNLLNGSETPLENGQEVVQVLEKHLVTTDGKSITFRKLKGDSDDGSS